MIEKLLKNYRSIIFLDGESLGPWVIPWINQEATLIVADGAAHRLEKLGVQPNYIVGDGDSYLPYESYIKVDDQNTTDFEKCIAFAKEKEILPSLVLGVSGGEIDHVLGNAQVLLKHAEGFSLFFLDPHAEGIKIGLPVSKQPLRSKVPKGTTLSVIPFGPARITSKGLAWEFQNQVLDLDGVLGMRNRTKSEEIEIRVEEGKALIIIEVTSFFRR
ncbi:thiamine diphosphokinase [Candidatus Neptunochlamydia vexilliferae]|uniref:thiamine diphosphokinase n=1 Tax=Candidatus Neptunichlamydia vexilliferae TaxID=1651774 RepID=UPI0018918AE1|nr:thiamine diphosphokinase [Candidatus Neptunochlamydia vexilliferae]